MYNFKIFDIFLIKRDTSKGKKMSFESSSEDPMDYLKTKDSEKEPLLGGKVAEAPAGKYNVKSACLLISHYNLWMQVD